MTLAVPRVSVVIPNFNGAEHLARCLSALERQELDGFETIVVDNGSTDGSRRLVRARFGHVRLVELPENRGFAGAANRAAELAQGDYVALLNNDAEAEPSWLVELLACAERHPRAASIASKVLRVAEPGVLDGAGDAMTRALKAFRRGAGEPDDGRYSEEEQVFSASGTACLWRTSAFRDLGGFDESFFAYYEDVDLGFRARLAGFECWYAPRAVVRHVGAATSTQLAEVDARYSLRNRWATAIKDAPLAWLLRNALIIGAGELLLWARILRDREPRLLARHLLSRVYSLVPLLRARREIQRARVVAYHDLIRFADRWLPPPRA